MNSYELTWIHVNLTWIHMNSYEFMWVSHELYEFTWICIIFKWIHMNVCEFIWIHVNDSYSLAALAWGRVQQDGVAVCKHNSVHAEILALSRRCRCNAALIVMRMPKNGALTRQCRVNSPPLGMHMTISGALTRQCRVDAPPLGMHMTISVALMRQRRDNVSIISACTELCL